MKRGVVTKHSFADVLAVFLSQVSRHPSGPSVLLLLFPCRPPAIFRFIVSVIVDAVQSLTLWRRSHVSKEIFEHLPPSSANLYPSTAVVVPSGIFRVSASLDHVCPNAVSWR
jgi:hypothetical protein